MGQRFLLSDGALLPNGQKNAARKAYSVPIVLINHRNILLSTINGGIVLLAFFDLPLLGSVSSLAGGLVWFRFSP